MYRLKKFLKAIPGTKFLKSRMIKLGHGIRRIYALIFWRGERYSCPICGKSFKKFFAAGLAKGVLFREKVIGGGYRENAVCPNCGAAERLRLEYLFMQRHTDILTGQCKVLHFAPEDQLTRQLCRNKKITYLSGDLQKGVAMAVVDITAIQFNDDEFDYVICNHVLEHITEEGQALKELARVLKPNGKLLITVPISYINQNTGEQKNLTGDKRLELYGQTDHVRLYGADFPERLQKAGFKVETYCAGVNIAEEYVHKYALLAGETVYICS